MPPIRGITYDTSDGWIVVWSDGKREKLSGVEWPSLKALYTFLAPQGTPGSAEEARNTLDAIFSAFEAINPGAFQDIVAATASDPRIGAEEGEALAGPNIATTPDGRQWQWNPINQKWDEVTPDREAEVVTIEGRDYIRQPNGNLTPIRPEPEKDEPQQGTVVTIDGRQFIQQPNGSLTPLAPEKTRSVEQEINDLVLAGQYDEASALSVVWRQVNQDQITPLDAFQIVAPMAQNPTHFRELMTALMADAGTRLDPQSFESLYTQSASSTKEPNAGQKPRVVRTKQPFTGADINIPGGLTQTQWDALTPDQKTAAAGMEMAGSLEEYLKDPDKYADAAKSKVADIKVKVDANQVSQTGSFDPSAPARTPFGTQGMRTAEEEKWLTEFDVRKAESEARGVDAVPRVAQERFASLSAKSPFESEDDTDDVLAGSLFTGEAPQAHPGTPFFQVPTDPQTPFDVLEERFIRDVNEQRQGERGPVPIRTFG